jgi:hypothetical protein
MQHHKTKIKIHKSLNTSKITDHGSVYNSWKLFLPSHIVMTESAVLAPEASKNVTCS